MFFKIMNSMFLTNTVLCAHWILTYINTSPGIQCVLVILRWFYKRVKDTCNYGILSFFPLLVVRFRLSLLDNSGLVRSAIRTRNTCFARKRSLNNYWWQMAYIVFAGVFFARLCMYYMWHVRDVVNSSREITFRGCQGSGKLAAR